MFDAIVTRLNKFPFSYHIPDSGSQCQALMTLEALDLRLITTLTRIVNQYDGERLIYILCVNVFGHWKSISVLFLYPEQITLYILQIINYIYQ